MKPLQQLIHRYAERRAIYASADNVCQSSKRHYGPINVQGKKTNRPMLSNFCEPQYTGWRTQYDFSIKLDNANNCVKMSNNDIVLIENIATKSSNLNCIIVIGRHFEKLTELFNVPCSSNILGIYMASELSCLKSWHLDDIIEKIVCFPLNDNESVVIPFVHF